MKSHGWSRRSTTSSRGFAASSRNVIWRDRRLRTLEEMWRSAQFPSEAADGGRRPVAEGRRSAEKAMPDDQGVAAEPTCYQPVLPSRWLVVSIWPAFWGSGSVSTGGENSFWHLGHHIRPATVRKSNSTRVPQEGQ